MASFGSKYRASSIWTLKCFVLSYKSNVTKLSWFVYFEQMKTFHGSVVVTENLQNWSECLLQQLWLVCVFAKRCIVRWRYVSQVLFYRSKTCDNAYSFWKYGSTLRAGVGVQLVDGVRSFQCHLTLKNSSFWKNRLRYDGRRCSNDSWTLGQ